ncbi:hypothetical protein CCHR01_09182 [Colletotrichum chrysophilum]|uniref:Uncharacterized protein n=1 Tax=Colletotrichum chrysophilum TaxID=1836956 RepID=A0AAD9EH27_9PEZI|nr:hypothetical protein CCHR01_09182 [Colletotrichum chrysophilum]
MRRKCLITKAPGPVPSPFGTSQCRRRLCVPQPYMLTYLTDLLAKRPLRQPFSLDDYEDLLPSRFRHSTDSRSCALARRFTRTDVAA